MTKIKQKIIHRINELSYDREMVFDIVNKISYSYRKLFSLAYEMKNHIVKNSDKEIIAILDNGMELFLLYFAAMFANKTMIPIDPQKSTGEITLIIEQHKEAMLIKDITIEDSVEILEDKKIQELFTQVDFDKTYLITYTSGSTGMPKGVMHTVNNLFYSAVVFGEKLKYSKDTVSYHGMPMTYMAGILNTIILPFIMGGKIIVFPRFSVRNALSFWKNVITYQVNTFWFSPTMVHLLMKIDRGNLVVEYFKNKSITISVGTAPLSIELKKAFENKYHISLYQSYGLSETLFLTSADETTIGEGSVGSLLEGVELDIDYNTLEIMVAVPWMFQGYTNAKTMDYFKEGKYLTGDMGKWSQGELFIIGRSKDLIVKGGINIFPKDIERCLEKLEGIIEVCVSSIIVNNEERIICWYSGEKQEEGKLNNKVMTELGKKYKIDYFVFLKELPKNLNGKIDKIKLKELYGEKYDSKV